MLCFFAGFVYILGMRIAHLSDLHFSQVSLGISQFFSKRWLGNLNLLFSRKKNFTPESLFSLIPFFKQEKIDYLIITGDLSTTSLHQEFKKAAQWVNALEEIGIKTFILPGNHDHYTKRAYREKRFYHYFPSPLQEKGVSKHLLSNGWWLIQLDTTLATSLLSSRGNFTPCLEQELAKLLNTISPEDKVIIANHFPLFNHESPRKALVRADALEKLLLNYDNIAFYLHGHTHRECVADLRVSGLPIVIDCGSTAHSARGSFNLFDLTGNQCHMQVFHHERPGLWKETKAFTFSWEA